MFTKPNTMTGGMPQAMQPSAGAGMGTGMGTGMGGGMPPWMPQGIPGMPQGMPKGMPGMGGGMPQGMPQGMPGMGAGMQPNMGLMGYLQNMMQGPQWDSWKTWLGQRPTEFGQGQMREWMQSRPDLPAGMQMGDIRAQLQSQFGQSRGQGMPPGMPPGMPQGVRPDRAFNGGPNPTPEQIAARNRARPTPMR